MRRSPLVLTALMTVPLLAALTGCATDASGTAAPSTSPTVTESPDVSTPTPTPTATAEPTPVPTEAPTPTCENILTAERLEWLVTQPLEATEREVWISEGSPKLPGSILCLWAPPGAATDAVWSYGWAPLEAGQRELIEAELEPAVPNGASFERTDAVTYYFWDAVSPTAYEITDEALWIAPFIEDLESVTWGR
ncbi:hypothetical protein [Microbacterium sp. JZ31]|uniref:hypothetical protein n=1 Tax=Microbacterium sp. JZ31 TaxID=1906274 RepID=UPI001EE41E34|nr:hypothetical protein [Microbacterium sp. JZ31]